MKYIYFIFWLILCGVLFAFLQTQYAFHFFFIEQNQLFQNTWPYIAENLSQAGGPANIISEFLVQFYLTPYMGALITALLYTAVGLFTWLILKHIAPKTELIILSLLPAIVLLFIQFEFNYLTWGSVAFLIAIIALWGVLHIKDFTKRLFVHFVVTLALYWLAGSVFVVYALSATVYELFNKSPRSYLALLLLAEAALIGWSSVYFQVSPEYRFAFLPDNYYHTKQHPPTLIYFSWISFIALIAVVQWIKRYDFNKKRGYIFIGTQLAAIVTLCIWGFPAYDDAKSYKVKKMDYFCRTGQWDNILEECKGKLTNYLYICYANIALAEKGQLAEKAFSIDQHGQQGLIIEWKRTVPSSVLLSDVYFAINDISVSQQMAFEAYVGNMTKSPRMLQRLIQTNLIYGAYPVAEKYIKVLKTTHAYNNWAKKHERFLYNDKIVENDPLLGAKRASLLSINSLSQVNGFESDLCYIAEQNPSYHSTIEFLGIAYLLGKDMKSFNTLINLYYGTKILPALPQSFQEALIVSHENNPEKWKEYNISAQNIQRFKEYKQQILANKNNSSILPGLLNRSFGDTFWYYFMFK